MSDNESQFKNVEASIDVKLSGILKDDNLTQSAKALFPMKLTSSETSTLSKLSHPLKESSKIEVTFKGILIEINELQFEKAPAPIYSIVSGNTMFSNCLQS